MRHPTVYVHLLASLMLISVLALTLAAHEQAPESAAADTEIKQAPVPQADKGSQKKSPYLLFIHSREARIAAGVRSLSEGSGR